MNRLHLAATALAAAFLVTGCAAKPAPAAPTNDNSTLVSGSTAHGSGGNVPTALDTFTGSGGNGGVLAPVETFSLLDCTETNPCAGSGGNVPADFLVPGNTTHGSGGTVPSSPPNVTGSGGSGGVLTNQ